MKQIKYLRFIVFVVLVLFMSSCDMLVKVTKFEVTFDSLGGTEVESVYVSRGNLIPEPTATKEGSDIVFWYTSSDEGLTIDQKWSFEDDIISGDMTLYAFWDDLQVLENSQKNYYVAGNFNGWDTVKSGRMEATYRHDERIRTLYEDLYDAKYLYILEITLPDDDAEWTVTYKIDGTIYTLDGYMCFKVVRTEKYDSDARDWWAQSPDSGEINNLTRETLFILPLLEENVDQAGTWGDNTVAYTPGNYYVVFVEYKDGSQAMGLVEIDD